MGLVDYIEKKGHQEWLKRALDISWTAVNGIGIVFGPLTLAFKTGNPNRVAVEELIDRWLAAWQELQNQTDRILGQESDEYAIRSHAVLLPILLEFEQKLEAIRRMSDLDGPAMLAQVEALNSATAQEFFRFTKWVESEGAQIDFDAAKYQDKAVRKAHKFWQPIVRGLSKAMV